MSGDEKLQYKTESMNEREQDNRKSYIKDNAKNLVEKPSLDDSSIESKAKCSSIVSVGEKREGDSGLNEENGEMKEQHDVPEIRSNSEKDTDDKSSKLWSKDLKKKRVRSNVTHMSSEMNNIPAINNNNEISNVVPMHTDIVGDSISTVREGVNNCSSIGFDSQKFLSISMQTMERFKSSTTSNNENSPDPDLCETVARFFRDHGALYLKQAAVLDLMAKHPTEPTKWNVTKDFASLEMEETQVRMKNINHLAKRSYNAMMSVSKRVDTMQLALGYKMNNKTTPLKRYVTFLLYSHLFGIWFKLNKYYFLNFHSFFNLTKTE